MAKAKGAGPKVPKASSKGGKSSGRTQNPKFSKGAAASQVGSSSSSGMNVGGQTDAQVRKNTISQGAMLHKQFKKNKSIGLKPPK
jgi:hypothetical protein